ncbi:hypothetical protein TURU_166309 [Turdus rufiventris]|nr:hypothetical protein TURU_166309 [Turdus rufiventris]
MAMAEVEEQFLHLAIRKQVSYRSRLWMFVKSQDSLGSAGAEEEGKENRHCQQEEKDREGISFLQVLPAGLLIVLALLCRAA